MYQKRIVVLVVFFLGVTSFLLAYRQFAPSDVIQNTPVNTESEIATIHESILATEYQVSLGETAVYQAPNRVNGFRANFTKDGVELVPRLIENTNWSLALTLTQVGDSFGMTDVAPATLSAEGNQMIYDRGEIVEWYINNSPGFRTRVYPQ